MSSTCILTGKVAYIRHSTFIRNICMRVEFSPEKYANAKRGRKMYSLNSNLNIWDPNALWPSQLIIASSSKICVSLHDGRNPIRYIHFSISRYIHLSISTYSMSYFWQRSCAFSGSPDDLIHPSRPYSARISFIVRTILIRRTNFEQHCSKIAPFVFSRLFLIILLSRKCRFMKGLSYRLIITNTTYYIWWFDTIHL